MDSPLAEVAGVLADVAGMNPATGAYRYYASDHLGSTRGLYDGGTSALGNYEYSSYGELYASSGSVALEGLAAAFTGKPWDAAAQMYYFPYRWYSPSAARWLTRDPLGMVDGPNVYAYVRGNPITCVDPLGLFVVKKACCAGCAFLIAWDIYDTIKSKICHGKGSAAETAACVIGQVFDISSGSEMLDCLRDVILGGGSARDMARAAGECLACDAISALRDIAKLGSCLCCIGAFLKVPAGSPAPVPIPGPA